MAGLKFGRSLHAIWALNLKSSMDSFVSEVKFISMAFTCITVGKDVWPEAGFGLRFVVREENGCEYSLWLLSSSPSLLPGGGGLGGLCRLSG